MSRGKTASIGGMDGDAKPNCPCASFYTSAQVISALSSNEQAERLIKWIQGSSVQKDGVKFEKIPLSEQQLCENSAINGQPSRCTRRVDVAYSILNAIRDACRVHLEDKQGSTDSEASENRSLSNDAPKYEETFPSLSASSQQATPNILKAKKKVKKKIKLIQLSASEGQPTTNFVSRSANGTSSSSGNQMKVKRRIRPAHISSKQQSPWGNISQNDSTVANPWPAIVSNNERNEITSIALNVKNKAKNQMKSRSSKDSMNVNRLMAPSSSNKDPMDRIMNGRGDGSLNSKMKDPMKRMMGDHAVNVFQDKSMSLQKQLVAPMERGDGSLNSKMKDPMKRMMGDHAVNGFQDKSMSVQKQLVAPMEIVPSKIKTMPLISIESDQLPTLLKPSPQVTIDASAEEASLLRDNTVNAYSAIITSQLAPSIALELQLMLRLIAISDENRISNGTSDNSKNLERLFDCPKNCRQFSAQVFRSLTNLIVNLDRDILLKLLGVRVFVEHVPEVAIKIQQSLESHRSALLSEGKCGQVDNNTGLLVPGKSTILTTPFLEKRDSRHNYRSRDLSSMYNNREQCRGMLHFVFYPRQFWRAIACTSR